MQQEPSELMASIKKISNQVRYKLKAIEVSIKQSKDYSDSPADARIRRTQHAALLRKFVELMTEYNQRQTDYRDKCKEKIKRQLEIGRHVAADDIEAMLEQGGDGVFHEEIVIDPKVAKVTLADIEARHADLVAVETAIQELHDIFVDMAMMIDTQGEMIDRIETQVEDSVEFVDRANADMKKALVLQRAAMRKKLMIIFVSFIGGSLVLFIVAKKLGLA